MNDANIFSYPGIIRDEKGKNPVNSPSTIGELGDFLTSTVNKIRSQKIPLDGKPEDREMREILLNGKIISRLKEMMAEFMGSVGKKLPGELMKLSEWEGLEGDINAPLKLWLLMFNTICLLDNRHPELSEVQVREGHKIFGSDEILSEEDRRVIQYFTRLFLLNNTKYKAQ